MKAYGKPLFRWAIMQAGYSLPHEMQVVKYYLLFPFVVLWGITCAACHQVKRCTVALTHALWRKIGPPILRIARPLSFAVRGPFYCLSGGPLVELCLQLRETRKGRWGYVKMRNSMLEPPLTAQDCLRLLFAGLLFALYSAAASLLITNETTIFLARLLAGFIACGALVALVLPYLCAFMVYLVIPFLYFHIVVTGPGGHFCYWFRSLRVQLNGTPVGL